MIAISHALAWQARLRMVASLLSLLLQPCRSLCPFSGQRLRSATVWQDAFDDGAFEQLEGLAQVRRLPQSPHVALSQHL